MSNRSLFCALLAGLSLLFGCSAPVQAPTQTAQATEAVSPITYRTRTVEYSTYVKTVQGSADAVYPVEQTLTCPVSNAVLKEYPAVRNSRVKAGDVLAVFEVPTDPIRTTELTLQLKRARQAFETGKLERRVAIDEAQAAAELLTGTEKEIALLQVEKLRTSYDSYVYETQKSITTQETQLAELQATSGEITLTAPFDALVTSVAKFTAGDSIAKGKAMITLRYTDRFYLKIGSNSNRLRYNMTLTFNATSGTQSTRFTGKVICVGSMLPEGVSADYAMVQVEEGITYDMLGKQAKASFSGSEQVVENAIVISPTELYRDGNGYYVYVLENGEKTKRLVQVGTATTQSCWILDGLKPGDQLITD